MKKVFDRQVIAFQFKQQKAPSKYSTRGDAL